jgi:putative acetyltransferase
MVRLGTDDDGPACGDLIRDIFAEYPGCLFLPSEFPELGALASHFERRRGRLWVAEQDGAIVGCLGIDEAPITDGMELHKLYVGRTARGRGLAGRLYALAEGFARGRGAPFIELWTDTRFVDAHRFYERHGFTRLPGRRALDDASHSYEHHYRKRLALDSPALQHAR